MSASDQYGPVQRLPQGLLGFLQLKNAGRFPDVMIGSYQPTIELAEWLLNTTSDTLTFTTPVTNSTIVLNTPSDAWLYCPGMSLAVDPQPGAAFVNAALTVLPQALTTEIFIAKELHTVVAASTFVVRSQAIWLPPSSRVSGRVFTNIALAGNMTFSTRFTLLPV